MSQISDIEVINPQSLELINDPTGAYFLAYKTISGDLKTVRINWENIIKLFGVVQTAGTSSTDVMSQKAVSEEIDKLKEGLDIKALKTLQYITNPEYAFAIVDQDESVFFAIRWDTSLYCPYFDFATLKTLLQYDSDNEGRLARTVDAVGHVIEAIEKDGTKYIAKLRADSVDINRLKISNDGLDDLNTAMHRAGHLQTPTKESLGNTIGFASETQDGLMSKSQAKEINKIAPLEGLKDELQKLKEALSLDTLNSFKVISNPKYAFAIADQKENIFFAIRWDASLYSPHFDFERFLNTLQHIDDAEGRLAITVDAKGQILEATEKDGTKYIPRLKTDKLEFSGKKGLKSLGDALKSFGYFGKSDHSDKKLIQLPVPTHLAFMNLQVPKLPTTRDNNYKCPLEYWDMYGNYFKKDVIINAQGDSTLAYILKNIGLETVDGSKIQFDNWIAADSYHLKAHYTDAFRGESTLCYRYMKDITNTRPIGLRHPFDYQKRSKGFANGTGDITTDMASGANYIADGFPVALYHNGEFVSIMNMTQKKHRDNFEMDRNDPNHIWVDGTINTSTLWGEKINWPALEIRNPKPKKWDLVDIHGNKYITYDSLELSSDGNSGKVKKNLQEFGKAFVDMRTNKDKAIFDNTFFADNLHDYMIFSNVLYHFDGFSKNWQWYTKDGKRWAISVHDCDLMLGKFWRANVIMVDEVQATILGNEEIHPTYWAKYFYEEEFKQRYKELRDSGIVSTNYFVNKLSAWLGSMTAPMLKMDLKKWNFPSYRASGTDEENWQCVHMDRLWEAKAWDATKEYKTGERVYVQTSEAKYVFRAVKDNQNKPPILKQVSQYTPLYLGFYESVDRVRQFLDMRITLLDSKWEYKK